LARKRSVAADRQERVELARQVQELLAERQARPGVALND
jgi:hypothetical protein